MNILTNKKINTRVITTTLTFLVSVVVASGLHAQAMTGIPVSGDPDIVITARVSGCGDGLVETGIGEQCDDVNLNGKSCSGLGFTGGTLSCRQSCIFETINCNNDPLNDGSKRGGVRRGGTDGTLSELEFRTELSFSGYAEPGSWVVIEGNGDYIVSVRVSDKGRFYVPVKKPPYGFYNFTFYTISAVNGISKSIYFSTNVQQKLNTSVINIVIPYLVGIPEEILSELTEQTELIKNTVALSNVSYNPATGSTGSTRISSDIFGDFRDVLVENENPLPEELRDLIEVFATANEYDAEVPEYQPEDQKTTFLKYINKIIDPLPRVIRKWYPNIYISYMVPYRIFFYELIDLFKE
jgi:hypothetical protein